MKNIVILISGGGRSNFTNLSGGDHKRFLSANPHFARSALARHLVEAVVRPTLEVVITEAPRHLHRHKDPASGLNLIRLPG